MGSLSSTPKPQPPQVIYYAPPAATPAVTPSIDADPAPTPEKSRTENLLRRNRGIFGTVQTGFRGFLSQIGQTGQRKSLLGE